MKKILFCFCVLLALGNFFPISVVQAQGDGEPGLVQLSQCSGTDCSACNIVHLANGGIKWLIGILFVIFALLIAVAGVRLVMSGGNHSALDEAKSMFMNAIIGFIIILSAWLIVDTIMRALVGTEGRPGQLVAKGTATGYLFWSDVQCQVLETPEDKGQITLDFSEPLESAIDTGNGTAGSISIQTPAGTQTVDAKPCDSASMATTNFLGARVTINKQFIASAQRIDAAWRARGGNTFYRVTSVGGYNCRNIAGTSRRSNHAYGVAIDINPAPNPHCPSDRRCGGRNIVITNMPPAFRQLFINEGWGWGGNWDSSKDAMHFSKATGEGGNMSGN